MGDIIMKQCEKGHFYDDNRFDSCPYCKEGTGLGKQAVAAFQNQQIPQFQTAPAQPQVSAPAPAHPGFKFCTKCGNKAEASAKFCTGCGNPFPKPVQAPSSDIGKTVAAVSAPAPSNDIGKTVAVQHTTPAPASDIGKTVAVQPMAVPVASEIGKTVAVHHTAPAPTSDIGKTVAVQPLTEIKLPTSTPTSDIGKTVALKPIDLESPKKQAKTKPAAFMVCISGANCGDSFTVADGRNYIASGKEADIKLDKDSSVSPDCHSVITYNPGNNQFTLSAGTGRGITYLNGNQVDVSAELNAYDKIKVGSSELLFVPVCTDKFKWEAKD